MRINTDLASGLLTQAVTPSNTKHSRNGGASGRDTARANEIRVGAAVAKYGHLRVAEIARVVWPGANYPEHMAQRTCRRLVIAGYLMARRNALGGTSYVLTRAGAGWLALHRIDARHTLELSSVGGATFIHRTLATRFLIERAIQGARVAGEYEMAKRSPPFSIEWLVKALKKLPDGIVWRQDSAGRIGFEWVEVENAAKPKTELLRLLRVAMYAGQTIDGERNARLTRLIIVFDAALNHASQLMRAADELWGDFSPERRAQYENSVHLVSVNLRAPLVWVSHASITLHEYRQRRRK